MPAVLLDEPGACAGSGDVPAWTRRFARTNSDGRCAVLRDCGFRAISGLRIPFGASDLCPIARTLGGGAFSLKMEAPGQTDPTISAPVTAGSRHLLGPPFLRHYPAHNLVAWQPQGTLDDAMLDQIAEWLVTMERASVAFRRFVDLSQLSAVSLRTRHVFEFARLRAEQFAGSEPVRTAIYCTDWVGFGIACLYESLMEETPIRVRAFRIRAAAADWLQVPEAVLTLKDAPGPPPGGAPREMR